MALGWIGLGLLLATAGMLWLSGAPRPQDVSTMTPVLAFIANLAGFALILCWLGFRRTGKVLGFSLSNRNTYSLSRLQMGCWTVLIFGTLLTVGEVNLWRLDGGLLSFEIVIPGTVLAVMGIAAATTALTPAILSLKANQPSAGGAAEDKAAERVAKSSDVSREAVDFTGLVQTMTSPDTASLMSLVSGDETANSGTLDISKVQQLLLTGLMLAIYATLVILAVSAATGPIKELPGFSERLAELLAISHAGYLGYKIAPKPA